jgi:hypothetical protein
MRSSKKTLGVFLGIAAFVVVFTFAGHTHVNLTTGHADQILAADNGYPPPLPPPTPPPDDPTVA